MGSYAGRWGAVSGHVEGDPDVDARREIAEETGLGGAVTMVRRGACFPVEDAALERRWIVHPYLFDAAHRAIRLDWESAEGVWVSPTEILRRETVPALWASYARVAPSLTSIEADRVHGASYLALRGLEVLRDKAGWLAFRSESPAVAWERLKRLAHRLRVARPAMAALGNRINRVMYACRTVQTAACVEQTAHRAIGEAVTADEDAASHAAHLIAGQRVLTLSRSATVLAAIRSARPRPSVVVAASAPGGEGVGVAETLAAEGFHVTLVADAAVATVVAGVDLVLVGADAVLPSGAVVNKTGTRGAAMAARQQGIPFYAAAARDKVRLDEAFVTEQGPPAELYGGPAPVAVENPTFDLTPPELVSGIITEVGRLDPDDIPLVADALRRLATW